MIFTHHSSIATTHNLLDALKSLEVVERKLNFYCIVQPTWRWEKMEGEADKAWSKGLMRTPNAGRLVVASRQRWPVEYNIRI